MNEAEALIREVRANPTDDTPRLIYADYLEEFGDPRGEFVRIQVELNSMSPGSPGRGELLAREQEMLDKHAEKWLTPVRLLGADGVSRSCFNGGLIEKVRMTAAVFIESSVELCEIEPALHRVQLREVLPSLDALSSFTMPEQIRELDLTACAIGPDEIEQLAKSPWATQIESLILAFNRLEDAGVASLLTGHWPKLTKLNLDANRIEDGGAGTFATSELFQRLTEVSAKANGINSARLEKPTARTSYH